MIVRLDLRTPFTYIHQLGVGRAHIERENKNPSSEELTCSAKLSLGVPFGLKDEPLTTLANRVLRFLHSTTYPQRAHIERLLVTS